MRFGLASFTVLLRRDSLLLTLTLHFLRDRLNPPMSRDFLIGVGDSEGGQGGRHPGKSLSEAAQLF